MELGDTLRGDNIKFLELLNSNQTETINILKEQLKEEKELNKLLLKKLGIIEDLKKSISLEDIKPIQGYTSTKQKIADAEAASIKEFNELIESNG